MTLRWLTAGESHGPSLVAILEGLPAHVSVTSDDIRDALARRRLGYGRGARMKFEQDEVTIVGGVRHGSTQGGPVAIQVGNTEWPKWETVMSADPVDPAVARGVGAQRAPDPAPAGPRGPGGHAEVRLRRGAAGAGARLGPRDGRPGRPGPGRVELPRAGRRRADRLARHRARRRTSPGRPVARGGRPRRHGATRRGPGALPRRRHQQADGRADRPGPRGRRHPRRRGRGGGPRAAAGPGLARALGPAPRLAPGRRAHGDPGDQGRGGRRRLRAGGHARLARPRRDGGHPRRHPAGSAAGPAAPRAA